MKFCENCGIEHDGTFASGRFCSKNCARGFSSKEKRKDINEKVSKKLTKPKKQKICLECHELFVVKKRHQQFCSVICAKRNLFKDPIVKHNMSVSQKKFYENLENRKRLRDIGRKGGFGKRGYTKNGVHYDSTLEKLCFEWLEENNIKFEAHKNIPNSSKISDVYLPNKNLWIEIDGINREKKKKWLGKDYQYWIDKLDIYKQNNLSFAIVYSLSDLQKMAS